jgi:NADPH2:quinone reductase
MRAVVIEEFGGRDKLKLVELPDPEPGPEEVRIAVAAAGVNPVDWKIREGYLEGRFPHEFPIVLGWDVAGTVDQVGENVRRFAIGDEVYAYCRKPEIHAGSYAELVVVPEKIVAGKPADLSLREAAAVPLAALTAFQALIDTAGLRGDEAVLIHAAAGGVGHYAVQIARSRNARVLGTASADNHVFLAEIGVEQPIDYANMDFRDGVRKMRPEVVLDVVLDCIGGDTLTRSAELLRPGGRLVSIVDPAGIEEAKQGGVDAHFVFVEPNADELALLAGMVENHELAPHVSEVIPLAEAARAHELSEAGHTRGKIVLAVT